MVFLWLAILLFLGLTTISLTDARSYHGRYVTVDEFATVAEACSDRWMIQGEIVANSLAHRPQDGYLEFKVKSSQTDLTLKIVYPGKFPELNVGESWVMVEGIYSIEQRLLADRLWVIPKD
ncbi:MAG: cytochrome c maturation protein CcmE [Desulfitobacterium hafniense]|uniref:cytochrome c maturation protein CcmE domain-containing protein n=1 Tax=Desulfitobacterium hafniense TaxID=49338 RepID=UPI002B21F2A9|nr:cytochrome c maturation protein CcmE [Desulfitobacterium hafniense]MEA5024588.1 cytochrome c maturation protein CcmE [Desulfitobacterium hafniense]